MGDVTVTPEYGPYPYQSAGGDAELWAQTLAAGEHLRRVFDQWVEETERSSESTRRPDVANKTRLELIWHSR